MFKEKDAPAWCKELSMHGVVLSAKSEERFGTSDGPCPMIGRGGTETVHHDFGEPCRRVEEHSAGAHVEPRLPSRSSGDAGIESR